MLGSLPMLCAGKCIEFGVFMDVVCGMCVGLKLLKGAVL